VLHLNPLIHHQKGIVHSIGNQNKVSKNFHALLSSDNQNKKEQSSKNPVTPPQLFSLFSQISVIETNHFFFSIMLISISINKTSQSAKDVQYPTRSLFLFLFLFYF
jgi:hypothetical protein